MSYCNICGRDHEQTTTPCIAIATVVYPVKTVINCKDFCQAKCCEVAQAEVERLRKDYLELIMAVGKKFPDESRHETALRYIREAENTNDHIAKQALAKKG